MTASSAAFFCRSHVLPPILASVGLRLRAADVFLHQIDLDAGT